jgi:hypothetical protein
MVVVLAGHLFTNHICSTYIGRWAQLLQSTDNLLLQLGPAQEAGSCQQLLRPRPSDPVWLWLFCADLAAHNSNRMDARLAGGVLITVFLYQMV